MVAYTLTRMNICYSFVAFDSFTESGSTGTDGHCFHGLYLDHIQLWGCALYHLHPDSLSRGREAGQDTEALACLCPLDCLSHL